ncbi:MAG: ribulose-phosphate 3-epimerase [Nitrospirae bacterium]|nr:ribulose-phosphate 3-epimerase [Nitrospirota bacterium]
MTLIAPSILSADFARLGDEIRNAEAAGADWIHIDVMDGHFVPNITIGPLVVDAVRKITSLPLDVHLMIERPDDYIDAFAKAGSDRITVHAEVCPHLHRTLHHIRSAGALPGVSINPSTPVSLLEDIIEDTDMVLIMSVNPGFGGQSFIPQSLGRLRKLRALINSAAGGRNVVIEVDGGVTAENAREVADAGADVLVMGSAFFGAPDRFEVMRKLDAILERQQ